jgi:hypothetical protein
LSEKKRPAEAGQGGLPRGEILAVPVLLTALLSALTGRLGLLAGGVLLAALLPTLPALLVLLAALVLVCHLEYSFVFLPTFYNYWKLPRFRAALAAPLTHLTPVGRPPVPLSGSKAVLKMRRGRWTRWKDPPLAVQVTEKHPN